MATYIILVSYTQEGIQKVKDSPKRLDGVKTLARKFGAELTDFYLCMGAYDIIVIVQAPDDQTLAKFVLAASSLGYIRTTTVRAFNETEYREIIQSLP
jgi:uncharacterized protein with GYD domain